MSLTLIQGNSHEQTYTCINYPDLASQYWVGQWAIVPSLGASSVASGSLIKSHDNKFFTLELIPSAMEDVPIGSYVLVVQIKNDLLEYKTEIQERVNIKAQGIRG